MTYFANKALMLDHRYSYGETVPDEQVRSIRPDILKTLLKTKVIIQADGPEAERITQSFEAAKLKEEQKQLARAAERATTTAEVLRSQAEKAEAEAKALDTKALEAEMVALEAKEHIAKVEEKTEEEDKPKAKKVRAWGTKRRTS